MLDAADPSLASARDAGNLLTPEKLRAIGKLWQPAAWPPTTDASAVEDYRRPFDEYRDRVRHLGLCGDRLIDAGCGAGASSFAWATRFANVLGFDTAPARVAAANWQKARFELSTLAFVKGDVRSIPADDDTADAVSCNGAVFNLIAIEPVLRECSRVLKDGGVCHLGLTGSGVTYARANSGDPRLSELARKRIFNTLCDRHLAPLVRVMGPGWALNAKAAACLESGMTPTDLLTCLDCRPDQIMAARTIADDLGPVFSRRLLDELGAIIAGGKAGFGDVAAGRDWDAEEVTVAAREAGFGRIEWAREGWLSLMSDGTIEKSPCDQRRAPPREFDGRPGNFEMLLWKPAKLASKSMNRPDVARASPAGVVRVNRTPDAEWKFTSGRNTYWNARSRMPLAPIIEHAAPALNEFEDAILTPRHVGPVRDGLRVATGGVYDRRHSLLPVFIEREAYEIDKQHFMRLKNDRDLAIERISNAHHLKGSYVYLGILRNHFGHFLLETLSQIWHVMKDDSDVKVIFLQYESLGVLPSFAAYIFDLIGLDPDRIIILTRTTIVEHLRFPDSEFEIRWKARTSYADTFRELLERSSRRFPSRGAPRQLYLTRRRFRNERVAPPAKTIINEQAVEDLFAARGYAIVAPETLPIHEQMALVGGASEIAGLKGSALHLSLFCQDPNARLIQLGREQLMNQSLIDGLKDMESHQIFCNLSLTSTGSVIDVSTIDAALREM
jgi:capsular polysaccharide biosynthesis protein/SAM-dependent methyltransferase